MSIYDHLYALRMEHTQEDIKLQELLKVLTDASILYDRQKRRVDFLSFEIDDAIKKIRTQ
jgi:hypothetical protein